MNWLFRRARHPLVQSSPEEWKRRWQSLVPPENRDVPITLDGQTVVAFVQVNQFVMMLQDGLLMESAFFDVCEFFQRAGYHVIWLMRCIQDVHNGYLRRSGKADGRQQLRWIWRKPTTNFGRWSSDNLHATILLQVEQLPEGALQSIEAPILQRVTWAESDDATKMIPSRTYFYTAPSPSSPAELLRWLNGASLSKSRRA